VICLYCIVRPARDLDLRGVVKLDSDRATQLQSWAAECKFPFYCDEERIEVLIFRAVKLDELNEHRHHTGIGADTNCSAGKKIHLRYKAGFTPIANFD